MANGIHKVTEDFELLLSKYTGAPFVVDKGYWFY